MWTWHYTLPPFCWHNKSSLRSSKTKSCLPITKRFSVIKTKIGGVAGARSLSGHQMQNICPRRGGSGKQKASTTFPISKPIPAFWLKRGGDFPLHNVICIFHHFLILQFRYHSSGFREPEFSCSTPRSGSGLFS